MSPKREPNPAPEPRRIPEEDDWIFDPSLAAINRSIRREFREEAEEVESIVHDADLRSRHMADIAREHRNKGDYVSVATAQRTFSGYVVYAAGDFLTLSCQEFEVDIALQHVGYFKAMPMNKSNTRAGRPGVDGPGTFEMRLVERKNPYERVELGFVLRSDSVFGKMTATGQDHIVIRDDDGFEWVVPYTAIAFLARGGPKRVR